MTPAISSVTPISATRLLPVFKMASVALEGDAAEGLPRYR